MQTIDAALIVETNAETLKHIRRVQQLLNNVVANLIERARVHDTSKLEEPEAATFAEYTAKLKDSEYNSPEYKQFLADMKPALDHHYANNSHHPEHYPNGIRGMSLLDLIEMLVDWKAAGERHATGSIDKSLLSNKRRFDYGDELDMILRNTARELFQEVCFEWHCFGCGAGGQRNAICYQCGAGRHDYDSVER